MSTSRRIGLGIFVLVVLAPLIGCYKRDPSVSPDQFDPPPGIYPDQVGKLVLETKWDKNPGCIRDGPVSCLGLYVIPDDPDGTRIYHSVWIYDTPAEAVARLEESAGEKVIDETQSVWEENKDVGRLLVKSGFRNDGIGSCSVSYTDGPMLTQIASSFSCEAAKAFLKDLTAKRN